MCRDKIITPLGISEVQVLETAMNERGEINITIESTKGGTRCRQCGKWISKLHGQDDWVTIQHLPAFGQESLKGNGELNEAEFADWRKKRHEQIERGELTYVAHQLDFLVKTRP